MSRTSGLPKAKEMLCFYGRLGVQADFAGTPGPLEPLSAPRCKHSTNRSHRVNTEDSHLVHVNSLHVFPNKSKNVCRFCAERWCPQVNLCCLPGSRKENPRNAPAGDVFRIRFTGCASYRTRIRSGPTRHDTTRHDVTRRDATRHDATRRDASELESQRHRACAFVRVTAPDMRTRHASWRSISSATGARSISGSKLPWGRYHLDDRRMETAQCSFDTWHF